MNAQLSSFYCKKYVVFIGAMISCLLWGSAFPYIKLGYEYFAIASGDNASQILFAGIRFTMAGMFVVVFTSLKNRSFIRPKKKEWLNVSALSLFQTILQYILFYLGLAHTTGVKASIIEGVNVFVALFVSAGLFHLEKLSLRKLIGCTIGFLGVILVNVSGQSGGFEINLQGDLLIFLSTIAYAFSSVMLKKMSVKSDPVMLSGYQFIIGGIVMMLVGKVLGGEILVWNTRGILVLIHLALVSAVAYSIWGILLKHNPVSMVAVYGFMNPVFGVVLSSFLLTEQDGLGIATLISLALVCLGIFIVNKGEREKDETEISLEKKYDETKQKPVIRASICTGEMTAGFKNLESGSFQGVMLIRGEKDLEEFRKQYGIVGEITKEY